MAIRCESCGQQNPEGAALCEFCKALFVQPVTTPRPRPVHVEVAPPARGWRSWQVALIALAAAGAGFALRPLTLPPPPLVLLLPSPVALAPAAPPPVLPPAPPTDEKAVDEGQPEDPPPAELPVLPVLPPVAVAVAPVPAPAPAPASAPAPKPRKITVPYQAYEGSARRIIIPVLFNGSVRASMLLDTGAPGTVISTTLAERLGVLQANQGRLVTVTGGITGQAVAVLVVLDSLSVDEARTEFVPATVVPPMSRSFDGLVGMDFLGDYQVEIDTEHQVLVLTEAHRPDAPGGHDERWWREMFTSFSQRRAEWEQVHSFLAERLARSEAPRGLTLELAGQYNDFAQSQSREAELLGDRLERQASLYSVPREWRTR